MPDLPDLGDLIGIVDAGTASALDRITAAEDVVAGLHQLGDRLIGYQNVGRCAGLQPRW